MLVYIYRVIEREREREREREKYMYRRVIVLYRRLYSAMTFSIAILKKNFILIMVCPYVLNRYFLSLI